MSETMSWKAFIMAPMNGGSSPSLFSSAGPIRVMDIDIPGGKPVTLRVRWLFFWRLRRSALAQAWQTYSSSAASPSPRVIAVSASA